MDARITTPTPGLAHGVSKELHEAVNETIPYLIALAAQLEADGKETVLIATPHGNWRYVNNKSFMINATGKPLAHKKNSIIKP